MDFTNPHVTQHGNSYQVSHGSDAGLFVRFYTDAIEDAEESTKQGRPVFRDVDMISIIPVGDKTTEVIRPVDLAGTGRSPPDNVRFPQQYAAFKSKTQEVNVGTPITEWAPISKSVAMELKGLNIHTVEALASVADTHLNMGMRDLRTKAKAWLESAAAGAGTSVLVAENKQLKDDIEALKAQMAELMSDKPRRGRPPKGVSDGEDAS